MDSTYIKFELHATLGNVQLAAFSITPEHKNRVLRYWRKLHAKNIIILEREAPDLPLWQITIRQLRSNLESKTLQMRASSRENVVKQLEKHYNDWEIRNSKIDLIQEESCS